MTESLKTKTMKAVLHALSYGNIEVEASRKLADLKRLDPMKIFYRKLDASVIMEIIMFPYAFIFPRRKP